MKKNTAKTDLQQLIGNTLRRGVMVACLIAFVGGVMYLCLHGDEPMPDYTRFSYDEAHPACYTTLGGIVDGILGWDARSWIQLGVIALLLTPILRVLLSMVDFLREHDWLYAGICAIVLSVIIANSIGGF